MKKILLFAVIMALSSCDGGDSSPLAPQSYTPTKTSKLAKFMDKPSICDIIDEKTIQELFDTSEKVNVFDGGACYYSWRRADAKERGEKSSEYMMQRLAGKKVNVPQRQQILEHKFSIEITSYNHDPKSFIPRKLSQEELDLQIAKARERMLAKLSEKQLNLAGDTAVEMMVSQLKKSNDTVKITGIGDVAYWSEAGLSGLNILDGGTKILISLMIGETLEEDIENAKKIFNTINK